MQKYNRIKRGNLADAQIAILYHSSVNTVTIKLLISKMDAVVSDLTNKSNRSRRCVTTDRT